MRGRDAVDKAVAWDAVAEKTAEIARLRKGIQDYLDGNYPNPRSYRAQGPQAKCPHGHYYYEDCNSCDAEHFQKLIGETPSPSRGQA